MEGCHVIIFFPQTLGTFIQQQPSTLRLPPPSPCLQLAGEFSRNVMNHGSFHLSREHTATFSIITAARLHTIFALQQRLHPCALSLFIGAAPRQCILDQHRACTKRDHYESPRVSQKQTCTYSQHHLLPTLLRSASNLTSNHHASALRQSTKLNQQPPRNNGHRRPATKTH